MDPGVLPGHKITFAGKGVEHPDKTPGSLQVVAVQLPHARFEREGIQKKEAHQPTLIAFTPKGSALKHQPL